MLNWAERPPARSTLSGNKRKTKQAASRVWAENEKAVVKILSNFLKVFGFKSKVFK
jgi:hypothetical protein